MLYLRIFFQWPLLQHGFTSIPAWINNHLPSKTWDEITYQWCNCWSLGMNKWFHPTLFNQCNYISMLGFKLIHLNKRGPRLINCMRKIIMITPSHDYTNKVILMDIVSGLNQMATWWRHQMETFSALLALCAGNSPVSGEFPSQRPVTRSFDVFFDLCLN